MSEEAFTQLEREKTVVLEEIVSLRSDDLGKVLDVDETLLGDFEERHSATCCTVYDAWHHDNQALRQLYDASHRAPRLRRFPPHRSAGGANDEDDEDTGQRRRQRQRRRMRLPPVRPTPAQIRRVLRPSPEDDDDHDSELSSMANRAVDSGLRAAVRDNAMHREAVAMVRLALDRAEQRFLGLGVTDEAAEWQEADA